MGYTLNDVSLVTPSRTNLKYLKWNYEAVRKNLGPDVWICYADDASTDGTWEWMKEIMESDPKVKAIRNEGPIRLGHTILYDRVIDELVETDLFVIWHADMYATNDCFDHALELVSDTNIVSLTRIEPPLHPPGPEKVLADLGTEPEEFKERELAELVVDLRKTNNRKITHGIFAPWMCTKKTFQEIGGHDPLYAPQSKEDSDIFDRFLLYGCTFDQTWDGYLYHMTCRGSRYNPTLTTVGKESSEWLKQNERSTRNFIRKWGRFVKHDKFMHPIVPHKYDIGFVIHNCTGQLLSTLEPWASNIYSDCEPHEIHSIINWFQSETTFDLSDRLCNIDDEQINDIIISFDGSLLTIDRLKFLYQLPEILTDSGNVGEMEYDIFKVNIRSLQTYEHELIKLK